MTIAPRDVDAVLAARSFAEHRARATRLLRVVAPLVIESAPAVAARGARERTWDNYRALAAARDEHARAVFGISHRALVHSLAGIQWHAANARNARARPGGGDAIADRGGASNDGPSEVVATPAPVLASIPAPIAGWNRADREPMSDRAIEEAWAVLRVRGAGDLSIARSAAAHPRTFVVERGARAIIVVPARIDTLAATFAVMHELGHAVAWLAPVSREVEWPRALDEAFASRVARAMESDTAVARLLSLTAEDHARAKAARARRLMLARMLDEIEAGGATGELQKVPWALWDDPHTQAAYVEAEHVADELSVANANEEASGSEVQHGTGPVGEDAIACVSERAIDGAIEGAIEDLIDQLVERTRAIDAREW